MKIRETPLAGLLMIEPALFKDNRGYFYESFQQQRYTKLGIPPLVQDNFSHSTKHVLRGLHYQLPPHAQGKLVWVTRGSVYDTVVDIRLTSPTFGQSFSVHLTDENHLQLYIPPGFAHGFYALSEVVDFIYKCTAYYSPQSEQGILWNDPDLKLTWPSNHPLLSSKDALYSPLREIPHEKLFA